MSKLVESPFYEGGAGVVGPESFSLKSVKNEHNLFKLPFLRLSQKLYLVYGYLNYLMLLREP